MKTFRVRLTRELTESVDIEVKAESENDAHEKAYEFDTSELIWEADEGNEFVPYVTNVEELSHA